MTAVRVGRFFYPAHLQNFSNSRYGLNFNLGTINSSGDRVAALFQAQSADDIIGASFCTDTVATGETIRTSIQGVDLTTGLPDGSIKASGNCYFDTVVDTTDDKGYYGTFGTAYSPSDRELLALVHEAGPSWSSGDIDFMRWSGVPGTSIFQYAATYNGSSWTKTNNTPAMGIEYSGNRWYPSGFMYPADSGSFTTNIDGSPRYFGLKFRVPANLTICGLLSNIDVNSQDWALEFYTGSELPGSPTSTLLSFDKDVQGRTVVSAAYHSFPETDLVTETDYRLVFNCNSSSIALTSFPVNAHQMKEGFGVPYELRTYWQVCQANNGAGSWDDSTYPLRLPVMALEVCKIDDGTGSGGGSTTIIPIQQYAGLIQR